MAGGRAEAVPPRATWVRSEKAARTWKGPQQEQAPPRGCALTQCLALGLGGSVSSSEGTCSGFPALSITGDCGSTAADGAAAGEATCAYVPDSAESCSFLRDSLPAGTTYLAMAIRLRSLLLLVQPQQLQLQQTPLG